MTETLPVYDFTKQLNVRTKVINAINNERNRQFYLHGEQKNVSLEMLYVILAEEFGEVAEALQVYRKMTNAKETDASNLYRELIEVAAVATKMAERVLEGEPNEIR